MKSFNLGALEFKEEDFHSFVYGDMLSVQTEIPPWACALIRDSFNRILAEKLGKGCTVYGNPDVPNSWGLSRTGWCDKPMTHTARLVCIEFLNGGGE